jgi:transcriptional regulator with XRE-family HTH domain
MPEKKELIQFIAHRVKSLREEAGISQELLVEDTGLNIGLIEMGNTNVTIYTLYRICKRFNISLSEFFRDFK